MKYLLDTHTFIWSLLDIEKLSPTVYSILSNSENKIYVSSITFWEIAIKHQLKKITLEPYNIYHFPNFARQQDFNILVPDEYDYIGYTDLPVKKNHRDPFDRMLIHTAIKNGLTLLSKDTKFTQYANDGLQLLW